MSFLTKIVTNNRLSVVARTHNSALWRLLVCHLLLTREAILITHELSMRSVRAVLAISAVFATRNAASNEYGASFSNTPLYKVHLRLVRTGLCNIRFAD